MHARHRPFLCRAARVVMISRTECFTEVLLGATKRIELRRMIWNLEKGRSPMSRLQTSEKTVGSNRPR